MNLSNLPKNLTKTEIANFLGFNEKKSNPVCNEVMAERRKKDYEAVKNNKILYQREFLEVFKRFDVVLEEAS